MPQGKARIIRTVETDLENLERQANVASGPDKYVIRSMTSLVSSLFRLESEVDKSRLDTITCIGNLTETIKELDTKNSELQATGMKLTFVATVFTVLSFIQVVEILRLWFKWW